MFVSFCFEIAVCKLSPALLWCLLVSASNFALLQNSLETSHSEYKIDCDERFENTPFKRLKLPNYCGTDAAVQTLHVAEKRLSRRISSNC